MERYKIPCTQEQTQKALQLGAPIELIPSDYYPYGEANVKCPTAEEMIGWLEENGIRNISVTTYGFTVWFSEIDYITENHITRNRKEATIAAIDAALKYLSNKK